ncbi:MAG: hypothetical protein IJ442_08520 [Bacteroidaceae bacterium]|nr:hypothetical protein [Bacteroidaceae bacterium]
MEKQNKDVPLESIVKILITQNKQLLKRVDELERELEQQNVELCAVNKSLRQKESEIADLRKSSRAFYRGITRSEGFGNIIKHIRRMYKIRLNKYKSQRDELLRRLENDRNEEGKSVD